MKNRFQTNTAEKPIDRRRIHGFAPGLRMSMNPRASNLSSWNIPQGQLIIFNPRVDGYLKERMRTVVDQSGARVLAFDATHEFSGRHFASAVASKFQGGKIDFGFRVLECLYDLDYDPNTNWDAADEYFETLHPRISCEMGLEVPNPVGPHGDIINNGEPLPCPTCRLKWLNEKADEVIFNSKLDHNILFELKNTLISSYKAGRIYAEVTLGKVQAQIDAKNSAKTYQDTDYHFMKMLHKKEKHVEQAEIQNEAARVQGEAIGQAVVNALQAKEEREELERLRKEVAELKKKKKEA